MEVARGRRWRSPDFDWQGSDNLASATVLYPAPHRLHDKAGDVVGYKNGGVLFPVLVTPKDASKPVTLHGKVSYGVCKDICIPAEAELQLVIPPDVGKSEELSKSLTEVPGVKPRPGSIRRLPPGVSIKAPESRSSC